MFEHQLESEEEGAFGLPAFQPFAAAAGGDNVKHDLASFEVCQVGLMIVRQRLVHSIEICSQWDMFAAVHAAGTASEHWWVFNFLATYRPACHVAQQSARLRLQCGWFQPADHDTKLPSCGSHSAAVRLYGDGLRGHGACSAAVPVFRSLFPLHFTAGYHHQSFEDEGVEQCCF